jgi:hypothetical protein
LNETAFNIINSKFKREEGGREREAKERRRKLEEMR